MKRSLLKYSAWISIACMLCTSCSSSRLFVSGDAAIQMRESFLSGSFEKITCKTKVTFHENDLSGLMLIKKTTEGKYRLVFYNQLGITYLEGLFVKKGNHANFTVKNIIPVLNHKSFIKSFEKNLQILFSDEIIPRVPALQPPYVQDNNLIIHLKNGFILELKPQ